MSFPRFDPMKRRHMVCMAMAFSSWVMHQPETFRWLDTFKPLNFASMILATGGVYLMAPNGDMKPPSPSVFTAAGLFVAILSLIYAPFTTRILSLFV